MNNNNNMHKSIFVLFLLSTITLSAQTFQWNTPQPKPTAKETQMDETGYAVYYADYLAGNPTAMGENYDPNLMTAAHHKLPLGTIVKVSRMDNGLSTTVRINDRGAYCDDCVVDLSKVAAKQIDLIRAGRTKVYLTVIGFSNNNPPTPSEFISHQQNTQQFTARGIPANYSNKSDNYSSQNNTQYNPIQKPINYNQLPANYDHQIAEHQVKSGQTVVYNQTSAKAVNNAANINKPANGFAIQLGSYSQLSNAARHITALQNKGFDQIYVEKDVKADGRTINRVMVAPFESMAEAKQYLKDLHDFHNMDGIVVRIK